MHDFNDTLSWSVCFKAIFCLFQNQMNFLSGMSIGFWSLGELKKSAVKTLPIGMCFHRLHFLFSRTPTSVTITRQNFLMIDMPMLYIQPHPMMTSSWVRSNLTPYSLPTPSPPPQLKIRVPLWSRKMFFKSFQKYSEDRMMPMSNFTFAAEFQPFFQP